ncbi:MAG TPA: Uma2 family endonuclease [Candidatus Limnocylindria bacterium]|nr:Uma2 family endonuclease [Candidatus Limnocylindria bacterium]
MRTPVPIPETKPATELMDEWRHEFDVPGRSFASLVPDVAYLSRDALEALGPSAAESPPRAPEVAVEILSRGESERDLAWKVDAYLRAGTLVVFVVDPPQRAVIAHDLGGSVRFGSGESVRHPALPGFAYAIEVMFEGLYLGD